MEGLDPATIIAYSSLITVLVGIIFGLIQFSILPIKRDITRLEERMDKLETDVQSLKAGQAKLEIDVQSLKAGQAELKKLMELILEKQKA